MQIFFNATRKTWTGPCCLNFLRIVLVVRLVNTLHDPYGSYDSWTHYTIRTSSEIQELRVHFIEFYVRAGESRGTLPYQAKQSQSFCSAETISPCLKIDCQPVGLRGCDPYRSYTVRIVQIDKSIMVRKSSKLWKSLPYNIYRSKAQPYDPWIEDPYGSYGSWIHYTIHTEQTTHRIRHTIRTVYTTL